MKTPSPIEKSLLSSMIFKLLPIGLLAACLAGLTVPRTRMAALWLLEENHPVELCTFFFCFLAAGISLWLAVRPTPKMRFPCIQGFYLLFGLMILIVGLEEISWGQQFLHFETPDSLRQVNQQNETNLHNIGPLQGRSEWFRLLFGLGGLVGIMASRVNALKPISVPPILLIWFLTISGHAAFDAFEDFVKLPSRMAETTQLSSELVEMLIAMAAFLYVLLKKIESRSDGSINLA